MKQGLIKEEPVSLIALLAVVIVSGLAKAGIVLETGTVETLVVDLIIIGGAVVQRMKVTPVAKVKALENAKKASAALPLRKL
jgi:hypothetical protein